MVPANRKRAAPPDGPTNPSGDAGSDKKDSHKLLAKFLAPYDSTQASETCNICQDTLSSNSPYREGGDMNRVVQLRCKHFLHYNCVFRMMGDEVFIRCPTCNVVEGIRRGNQPDDGVMRINIVKEPLQGFTSPTIQIIYEFPPGAGIQGANHPNPGKRYSVRSFPRTAYLPFDNDGWEIGDMLKIAFERRLTFTIGTSVTDNVQDTITWSSIHHKTSRTPNTTFGYPDPNYFANVRAELAAVGITPDDIGTDRVPWDIVLLVGAVYS